MTNLRVMAALVAFAGLSGGAFVAPAHAQAGFDWAGPYIGVNAGNGKAESDWSNIMVPSDSGQNYAGTFSSSSSSGTIGGLQGGYNVVSGQTVYGFEAAVSFGSLSGADTCIGNYTDFSADCTTEVKSMVDLTGRLGVISGDRALIYAKAGASIARVEFSPQNEVGFATTGGYDWTSESRTGYVLGVGLEYAIQPNMTVGLEYDYRDYGNSGTDFTPLDPVNQYNPPFSADTSLKVRSVVARLNYKF